MLYSDCEDNLNFLKLTLINLFAISLIIIAFIFNIAQQVYANDISKLSYVISGLMIFVVLISEYDEYYENNSETVLALLMYIRRNILYVGLAGTLVGLTTVFGSLLITNSGGTDQLNTILGNMIIGLKTLFNTTLLAIIARVWIDSIITRLTWMN